MKTTSTDKPCAPTGFAGRAGSRVFSWTRTQPTRDGWYWYRHSDQHQASVLKVWRDEAGEMSLRTGDYKDQVNWLVNFDGEWSGPIPEPQ